MPDAFKRKMDGGGIRNGTEYYFDANLNANIVCIASKTVYKLESVTFGQKVLHSRTFTQITSK